jgi:hypothetical protein
MRGTWESKIKTYHGHPEWNSMAKGWLKWWNELALENMSGEATGRAFSKPFIRWASPRLASTSADTRSHLS